jgi:phosphoenolpyruvate carboxylase
LPLVSIAQPPEAALKGAIMAIAKQAGPAGSRQEIAKITEELAVSGQVPREILEKARVEMDRTIDRQVEPYRQKIRELERRRADIDEELKGLYMIVGFYDSVRMQAADGRLS